MKNHEHFLTMQEIVLQVANNMRHGIVALDGCDNDPCAANIAGVWVASKVSNLIIEHNIKGFVHYTQLVENDKVLVIGIQQEAELDGEQDPDKLFYCEVVRLSMDLVESWVGKSAPALEMFTEEELMSWWETSKQWTQMGAKYTELVNKALLAKRAGW